jgi:hypothetical protein
MNSSLTKRIAKMDPHERLRFKLDSIKALDFEAACAVDDFSRSHHKDVAESTVGTITTDLEAAIDAAYQAFKDRSDLVNKDFNAREMEMRVATDDSFQQRQHEHLEELHDLEKGYAYEVLFEEKRPVKERRQTEETAQSYAFIGDYPRSIKLREDAERIALAVLKERREKLDAKYERIKQNIIERQRAELQIMNEKLCANLDQLKKDWAEALDHESRTFTAAVRCAQQSAIVRATATSCTPDGKLDAAQKINAVVATLVKELSGIEIVPFTAAGRSRSARPSSRGGSSRPSTRGSLSHSRNNSLNRC